MLLMQIFKSFGNFAILYSIKASGSDIGKGQSDPYPTSQGQQISPATSELLVNIMKNVARVCPRRDQTIIRPV